MDAYLWYAPNIFEVLACNIGFKFSHCKYSLNVQDDMVLGEKDFDKRLMKPFEALSNIFAVTARDAVDVKIVGEKIDYYNGAGKDSHTPRNMFSIRDIINRGPILFDNEKLKELGYLNEYFYPMGQDDTEICLRAYRKGWLVGSYGAEYESRMEWGHTRRFVEICHLLEESEKKNMKRIIELHSDIINLPKHDKDIIIK
jgi:GT2 family glycosyltransferase